MAAKRPAPQFRPRGARQKRFWQRPITWVAGAIGVFVVGVLTTFIVLSLLDDSSGTLASVPTGSPTPASRGGTEGGPSPRLDGPASRYVPALSQLPAGFEINPGETYALTPLSFVVTSQLFPEQLDGEKAAEEWRFTDGYEANYQPVGLLAEVLRGSFYATVSAYRFEDEQGARKAYEKFESTYAGVNGSSRIAGVKGLGNQSSAWNYKGTSTVGSSDMVEAFHRFIFRRGNLVVAVQTYGGEPFMTIDRARDLAVLADERALGNTPATTPTPRPQGGTPSVPSR